MKRRRNLVLAILLVAAMALSIGYAAVSDVLTITGNANVEESEAQDAFNLDVYFSAAEAGRYVTDVTLAEGVKNTAGVVDDNNDEATFEVNTLRGAGDWAEFTFTIKNAGDLDATMAAATWANGNADYFDIATEWPEGTELKAGKTLTYKVTVTLKETPTTKLSASFNVDLTATAGETTGN